MAKDIFVEGVPLDEYLGKKEEEAKNKRSRKEFRHTERVPIKSKIKTKMVTEDTNKNGPVTVFSRRRIMQIELLKHVKSAPTTKSKIVALLLMGIPLTSKGYYNKLKYLCGDKQSTLGGVGGTLSLLITTSKLGDYITKRHPKADGNRLGAQYYIDSTFELTFDQAIKLSKTHLNALPVKKKRETPAEKPAEKEVIMTDKAYKDMQFDIMNLVMAELNPLLAGVQKDILTSVNQEVKITNQEIEKVNHEIKTLFETVEKGETLEAISDVDSISALLRHCVDNNRKISIIIE